MKKNDLILKVTKILHSNDVRKKVPAQKTNLYISDDEGHSTRFTVQKPLTGLLYTSQDVGVVVDAVLAVIEDCVKRGEDLTIRGFGNLGVHKRGARRTYHPVTGEETIVKARYVPKFTFGETLRRAAKVYEMSLEENGADT